MITFFSHNIVEEGLQMMHHTKFLKRCLAQPRLLLRTFLLGMLLTGCFAVMAGFGASMASAQSLNGQAHGSGSHRDKPTNKGQGTPGTTGSPDAAGTPGATGSPDAQGTHTPATNNNTTGSGTNAAGSNNSSGAVPVGGAVPGVAGVPGGGASRPGLPFTGSDPGNNPLP